MQYIRDNFPQSVILPKTHPPSETVPLLEMESERLLSSMYLLINNNLFHPDSFHFSRYPLLIWSYVHIMLSRNNFAHFKSQEIYLS